MPVPDELGVVGVGAMGSQLVRRLAGAGYAPLAFDRDPTAAAGLSTIAGVRIATSLRDLARCQLVITMLPGGDAVRHILTGGPDTEGLASHLKAGSAVVDMSSSAPQGTVELAERLRRREIRLLDAPVSGGVSRAASGTLSIMVGGHSSDLEALRGVFDVLGERVFHTGPVGSGHATKALNNMVSAAGLTVALEVLAVASRFGLDPQAMLDVLNSSTGYNNSTENKIAQQVFSRAFAGGFATQLMVKDLATAMELAQQTGTPVPVSAACMETWSAALQDIGDDIDHTAIARYIEQRAEVTLEPRAAKGTGE